MSVKVDLDKLDEALADFDTAYLISVGASGPKVVCVDVSVEQNAVLVPTSSRGTAENVATNPRVTVLCPPRELHGMSLIIDGGCTADGDGFRIEPTYAVLHRPASHATDPQSPGECDNDCQPL